MHLIYSILEDNMRILLALVFMFGLVGCNSKDRVHPKRGVFTSINKFEIIPFFSPYENYEQEFLFTTLVKALEEVGNVQISKARAGDFCQRQFAMCMLISIGGYQEKNIGSIQVFADVEMAINQFKTSCMVWTTEMSNQRNLPYPVIENEGVFFKTENPSSEEKDHPEVTIKMLISKFIHEYRENNSNHTTPTFYIHHPLFSSP